MLQVWLLVAITSLQCYSSLCDSFVLTIPISDYILLPKYYCFTYTFFKFL